MIDWYHGFLACTLILWLISTPRDRNALRIVLIASIASEVIVDGITSQIDGSWKLVIPSTLEILTILALLKWARGRTGYLQAGLLVIAWASHILCYVDFALKTDLVYSKYEAILFGVSVGQLIACYDTMHFNIGRITASATAILSDCAMAFRHPSHSAGVSLVSIDKEVSPTKSEREARKIATIMP